MESAGLEALTELALDLRWSWNHAADQIWQQLDPQLWALTHNPWIVLQTISRDRIAAMYDSPPFRQSVDALLGARRSAVESPAWFQGLGGAAHLKAVAYFSMEFMLSEALPIYSGGLGNVAGDQLKAASDLGVPVLGVGLLYQQGYLRQLIDHEGRQQAVFPYNDPGQLPIAPLRTPTGEWLRVELTLPGHTIWLRAWQVRVGRTMLYLLDSNDAANFPPYRAITSELYGDEVNLRLMQELVLGIGGWRLLRALGIDPEVCHLNEGHAAFVVLERTRCYMQATGQPFDVALAVTRTGNVFTTHTAVAAGFDRYTPQLLEPYLAAYAERELGLPFRELLALGRVDPADAAEPFNMAHLAIRGSRSVNAVSQLHGQVSRRLFAPLFPRWPLDEVPVGHVTNGVHVPSWDSAAADALWTEHCGKDRWLGNLDTVGEQMRTVPAAALWSLRQDARRDLVQYLRDRLSSQLSASGAAPRAVEGTARIFDPQVLTLGFARRFAAYKRPNLLLHDPERLRNILCDAQRPVQLILAGTAHPADEPAQALIQQWIRFIRQPEIRPHAMFLSDYDMQTTERLVQGVDVWLNTPRRPWEASGTSGMKVLVNGGLNLSELDGWWAEAYSAEVGWALGDGQEHPDDAGHDAAEADALYRILEQQVIPEFYAREGDTGLPLAWLARIAESMARLTPRFSTNRVVRDYTLRHYLPAAQAYRDRAADGGLRGAQHWASLRALETRWATLSIAAVRSRTGGGQHEFEAEVHLGEMDPGMVRVELYAQAAGGRQTERIAMALIAQAAGNAPAHRYRACVPAARPVGDYTVRLSAAANGLSVPLECPCILWQR